MKSIEEKIKICSNCKNRGFNPECGIVCSITNAKPAFEEGCENYVADKEQISKQTIKMEAIDEDKSISGWLFIFLWVGVGFGTTFSVIQNLKDFIGIGLGWLPYTIAIAWLMSLSVTAIATIIAFYKEKTNAVALASTYIAMIALDGLMSFVLGFVLKDDSFFLGALRQLAWAAIWFTYIQQAYKIKLIIPTATRTWNKLEKILLALFVLAEILLTSSIIYVNKSENPQNIFFTNSSFIDKQLEQANKELPAKIADGLTLQRIAKEHKSVVYTYQFTDLYSKDTDASSWDEFACVSKHELLYNMSKSPDSDVFASACLKEGYDVIYEYINANSKSLYDIRITPAEYQQIVTDKSYKCPINDISALVNKYNMLLPADYIGNFSLRRIYLASNDSELVYIISLPRMTDMSSITPSYLREYISKNWSNIIDSASRLAMVNQMTIVFEFNTYSGLEYAKIAMTPDIYNTLEQ